MDIPKIGTPVVVTWLDSTTDGGWMYHDPAKPLKASVRKCRTIAWIAGQGPAALALAYTISDADKLDGREGHLCPLAIPLGCIIDIKPVTL